MLRYSLGVLHIFARRAKRVQLLQNRVSGNVGGVKHFLCTLQRALCDFPYCSARLMQRRVRILESFPPLLSRSGRIVLLPTFR
jgi:hypothetical protein